MNRRIPLKLFVCLFLLLSSFGAGSPRPPRVDASSHPPVRFIGSYGPLPLAFEPNQGQADPQVKYLARGNGYTLFVTPREAVLVLGEARAPADPRRGKRTAPAPAPSQAPPAVLRLGMEGALPHPVFEPLERLPGISNYFLGSDPARWHTRIPQYAKVAVRGLYGGTDMVYYGTRGKLEYDIVVQPGGDPKALHLKVTGAQGMAVNAQGDLELRTPRGAVILRAPVAYQVEGGQRIPREGRYRMEEGNRVGFDVRDFDPAQPLVIDPVLDYSTLLAGYTFGNITESYGLAVDSGGNAYVTGDTGCLDFPTTPGSAEPTPTGGVINTVCGYVTKFNPSGSAQLYSTYLGGSVNANCFAIALDSSDNAYITGRTDGDFPTTPGAYQTTATYLTLTPFVTKLDPTGSTLVYSTYLGSNGDGDGIQVDASGDAYVAGESYAAAFPTTPGCYQPTNPTGPDLEHVIVCELNPAGSALLYSTYLAGSSGEGANAIALDAAGHVYVTGYAYSANFPVTPGAFLTVLPGLGSAFVSKLSLQGLGKADLVYSTFLCGSSSYPGDAGNGISVDGAGNAYVTGTTQDAAFPTTGGALQTAYGGDWDAFVTKLNPSGSGLVYSTFLGGPGLEFGSGVTVDALGDVYLGGETRSADFPVTPDAFQAVEPGSISGMVAVLNPAGSGLLYSTFLGGNDLDLVKAIALDPAGDFYVAGNSFSTDFPTTSGAFQASMPAGQENSFVVKFGASAFYSTPTPTATPTGTPGASATATPTPSLSPTATTFSNCDDFYVSKNLFQPSQGPVTLLVDLCQYPGDYSLRIYNSAGEWVKTLQEASLTGPLHQAYAWDGTNRSGEPCASGVYLISLREPTSQKIKKILLVR